jgi:MFS family permease
MTAQPALDEVEAPSESLNITKQENENNLEHRDRVFGYMDGEKVEIHDWTGPDDPENPFNWSKSYKWAVTITVCFVSILTGLCAGSYGAASDILAAKFSVQNVPFPNISWGTASWNMGAALLPLVFVPLTENTGRMPGYFGAYFVYWLFLFPQAFAQNFATLVVARFFGGGASSTAINIVDHARSLPMSLFGFTSVVGIALGPFMASAILNIHQSEPWRW